MSATITSPRDGLIQIETRTPPTRFTNRLQTGSPRTLTVDVASLEAQLHSTIEGEVRFGGGDRGMPDLSSDRPVAGAGGSCGPVRDAIGSDRAVWGVAAEAGNQSAPGPG